jgi:alpha-amylase
MSELNGVMMQFFHWYTAEGGQLWNELKASANDLANLGVTSVWLPPPYKGNAGGYDVGYGVYDLFDLGEFDQKGSVPTKYGTKDELIAAIDAAHEAGMRVYADTVFNHKMGGDAEEEAMAKPFNPDNRQQALADYIPLKAWTHFKFEGRNKTYSEMEWHWHHFTAIDHNAYDDRDNAIYLFEGAGWDDNVDLEKGNFDYLMGCDLNTNHPEVVGELDYWGQWFVAETGIDGFRFDAVKHVNADFFSHWLGRLRAATGKELFAVGEYWSYEVNALQAFINTTEGAMSLFDAPLQHNFHTASAAGNSYDMRQIFEGSLVLQQPELAVTLVENHDTQPLQGLEAVVEPWFKPLAYALILLRERGYPCVFYADYYGADYRDHGKDGGEYDIHMPSHKPILDVLLKARKEYAYGEQYDYFDHANCLGWTRLGNDEHPYGLAVVLSNGDEGFKTMETTKPNQTYQDVTGHIADKITTDDNGWAEFRCPPGSVSVWVPVVSL